MKKFISMTMAAIMAASIVPSTAFAANDIAQIKTVGEIEWNVDEAKAKPEIEGVELQMKLKDFAHSYSNKNEIFEVELEFDGAYINTYNADEFPMHVYTNSGVYRNGVKLASEIWLKPHDIDDTTLEFEVRECGEDFHEDDKIIFVATDLNMKRYSEGAKATVSVSGDFGEVENLPVAAVVGNVFKLDYSSKLTEIPEESERVLKTITIKSKVGTFSDNEDIKIKLNKDFEIANIIGTMITGGSLNTSSIKENEFTITPIDGVKEITISGMVIESLDTAKPGDIATIEVKCKNYDAAAIDVAKVVGSDVKVSVDEDEDIPVMYSGTDKGDTGLDTKENHKALTVTIEEVTPDSWNEKNKWTLTLPEGVYVTNIEDADLKSENMNFTNYVSGPMNMFKDAYKEGDYEAFEFGRRSFTVDKDKKAKLEFTFELIAEPGFEGEVELGFDNGEYSDKVVIAEFVSPYKVEAVQNDVKIDYRYTKLDSTIVVTEAEEDLWKKGTEFKFDVEHMNFEDTTTYDANFDVKELKSLKNNELGFKVEEVSDEEPFKVVIKDMSLYMDRNLPAGGYDLIMNTTMSDAFMDADLFGSTKTIGAELYDDADEFDKVVKENFVNIITGADDTFTTKVEVPVGKDYIVAGDKVIALDVPAYINADNYTMLPVRAVAVALGIDNDAIVWNAETRTVTIFHGARIISMTVGAKVMTVNGTVIPTATSVEVVNGRMFIPMRDLATAMNAKLDWNPVTRTATFN